jgi:cell division protein ZapE
MTPLSYYHKKCRTDLLVEDAQQLAVLQQMEALYHRLLKATNRRSKLFFAWRKFKRIPGLYLWGGVGIGKTFLMDCFYQSLPFPQKLRMHFHQFMQMIHQELKQQQGKADPLKYIAQNIADNHFVLCFDELFVSDITDAMLLGRLFQILIDYNVCLVFTSNIKPDELYKNGLQRQHFLPVIALLKQHTNVIHIASQVDYRLRHLRQAGIFYIPNDDIALIKMEKNFAVLAKNNAIIKTEPIEVCHRKIAIKKAAEDIVWFDFNIICSIPRSQHDYLEIAKRYKTVFISDIPIIPERRNDQISLFIRLVDVFYDAKVRLVLSAEARIENLYTSGKLTFEFARTCSRLIEMQSEEYFLASSAEE